MSEVIVITSGKGGVGKTTTTANIGIGLANYINLLDPDLIILFGGLTNAGDIFLKKVKEVLRERQMKFAGRQVKLVISQMGENGTAVGSASLVLKKFIKYGN